MMILEPAAAGSLAPAPRRFQQRCARAAHKPCTVRTVLRSFTRWPQLDTARLASSLLFSSFTEELI